MFLYELKKSQCIYLNGEFDSNEVYLLKNVKVTQTTIFSPLNEPNFLICTTVHECKNRTKNADIGL